MTTEPYSKFYWSDWRGDPKLRMCSLAARGLWIEMLGIMHEAEPYGHFLINGTPPTAEQLASLCGTNVKEIFKLKNELMATGVPSIVNGVWHSRRMVRDMKRKIINNNNAKKGGNPQLKDNQKPPSRLTEPDNPTGYPTGLSTPDITHGNSQIARSQKPLPERNPLGQLASMPGAEKIPLPTDLPTDWLSESIEIKKWNEPTARAVWERFREFYNGKTKTYIHWKVDWCKWWSGENYKENTMGSSEHFPKENETWEQYCQRRGMPLETQEGAYA